MSHTDELQAWFHLSSTDVLDKFYEIPNSVTWNSEKQRFVLIEGTRPDRALLICHADTVWTDRKIESDYYNGIFYSKKNGVGIGADDRAGCAIVWSLRNLGHSILVLDGEESGLIGSSAVASHQYWINLVNRHSFMMDFDRRNFKDIVFYDIATNKFVEYIKKQTGYIPTKSFGRTDVCKLAKEICGFNISVGFFNEHTGEEKLVYEYWLNTLATSKRLLSQKNIPRFELDNKDRFYISEPTTNIQYRHNTSNKAASYHEPYRSGSNNQIVIMPKQKARNKLINNSKFEILPQYRNALPRFRWISCKNVLPNGAICNKNTDIVTFYHNNLACPSCGTML